MGKWSLKTEVPYQGRSWMKVSIFSKGKGSELSEKPTSNSASLNSQIEYLLTGDSWHGCGDSGHPACRRT